MHESTDITRLADEYKTLVAEIGGITKKELSQKTLEKIQKALVSHADWTSDAATRLLDIATQYGIFMLRNACALAIALEIEDGELGL